MCLEPEVSSGHLKGQFWETFTLEAIVWHMMGLLNADSYTSSCYYSYVLPEKLCVADFFGSLSFLTEKMTYEKAQASLVQCQWEL